MYIILKKAIDIAPEDKVEEWITWRPQYCIYFAYQCLQNAKAEKSDVWARIGGAFSFRHKP